MSGFAPKTFGRHRMPIAAAFLFALLASGCSSGGGAGAPAVGEATHGYSGSGSLTDLFMSSSAKAPQTASGGPTALPCPPVEVRQGASTLTVSPPGDRSAMTVQYQGDFVREARECAVVDGNIVMRIGIEGRVIVGPRGAPGQVDVPLRIAVVQEAPGGMRPVTTRFIRVPVVVPPSMVSTPFTHIEEGLSFPVPTPAYQLDDYIAYIGFDPLAAQAQDQPKPKAKPAPKARPKPAASAN